MKLRARGDILKIFNTEVIRKCSEQQQPVDSNERTGLVMKMQQTKPM